MFLFSEATHKWEIIRILWVMISLAREKNKNYNYYIIKKP